MHLLSCFGPKAASALLLFATQAISQSVPSPNLDLKSLGEVTLAGNFDAISVYTSVGQQQGYNNNGTQSVLSQLPNGAFDVLSSTDASIEAMCPLVVNDTLMGIVVGGNFTSVGGVAARSLALLNATTLEVRAIGGVQGTVSALYCDQANSMFYVGGAFDAGNSTNAIGWAAGNWSSLPFAGFDGPVSSITKAPNGHIVFGGSFTGLGNVTFSSLNDPETQVINLSTANISAQGNTTTGNNIVCPSNNSNSASDFLLADATPGRWRADFGFGFEPTRLRLWQTSQAGRGTKTWRFTAHPLNGILNLTTTDRATGDLIACQSTCPLAEYNATQPYQDFYFVNLVGMNSFSIDISDWYGDGAGLGGIELFQNDIFSYAIESFNEPTCQADGLGSTATATGPWYTTPSLQSVSEYLTVVVGPEDVNTANIIFQPNVQKSGNYSIIVYTPGCLQDSSCSARAIVNVTGSLTQDGKQTFGTTLFQTNNFDKYDIVFQGYVDATTTSFRPSVTLRPSGLQQAQLVVASRVKFGFTGSTTGGLNGLFDYDPKNTTIDYATADFSEYAINNAGTMLKPNANVLAMAAKDDTLYVAGRFSDDVFENIMGFSDNNASSLPGGGLNSAVSDVYSLDDFLYVGGNFSNVARNNMNGLSNVAAYQYSKNTWVALGAGLNGPVEAVEPMQLNLSQSGSETVIAFSGPFNQIRSSGSTPATRAAGLAIWVPSRSAWLAHLDVPKEALAGQLFAATFLPNNTWLGAGTLDSLGLAVSGAAGMRSESGQIVLSQLPVDITSSDAPPSTKKRAVQVVQDVNGVTTGLYYTENDQNVTIMGGHFAATATGGAIIENLMFLNFSNNNRVTGPPPGLDTNSTIVAMALSGNILFAGGNVSGQVGNANVAGLVLYDMSTAAFRDVQPASLRGPNVVVNAIAPQSGTSAVYVGGAFSGTSQDLSCPVVCSYDTLSNQWSPVGTGLEGTVSSLFWRSNRELLAAGDLTVQGNRTSLATYNTKSQTWDVLAVSGIPGPVTAFCPATADANTMWIAGSATNGSTFLVEIDGTDARPVPDVFGSDTTIRGLQIMPLTRNHRSTPYLDNDYTLMVSGQLNITGFGNAAAALFNGTHMEPLILASTSDGSPGSISQVFTSNNNVLRGSGGGHSLGIVILVALCAALGTLFLIILIGIILNRIQRRRAGYKTVPSVPYTDKHSNIHRVPPEALLGGLSSKQPGAPTV
ncbi:hypothetical protein A1O7_00214 [Cladophialophora yegresii CBS 114405]|uniref:Cellular morphogenesis protein n=1 Tax=Cladophialophora yegresii CBS 114405 TaxID=1182544 RepID=W9X077_9EURO|nr:uncharacterized protein A1O7_00214 [Cladophialophora yegresii CBS 114405]EXJ63879.1 hypothetical protein A1O7_00214 [Cladophialophora yegresii CBS 114405]